MQDLISMCWRKLSMEQINHQWLPHLSKEIVEDARGPEFDAYLVALEGWRRGLTLRWHTKDSEAFREIKTWFVDRPGKLFSLRSEEKTHYFFRTRGDKVTNEAVAIGADKEKTKEYLAKAGIPIPEGRRFVAKIEDDEIISYAAEIGYPLVVKPTDGSFGRGVVTNIEDEVTFAEQLRHVRHVLNYKDVIVERHVAGKDYRLYVVGDKVVAAIERIPANVVGNGKQTIQELIEAKNEERQKNPRLISCPIKLDQEMKNHLAIQGYGLDTIPEDGEMVFLTNKSNISIGGDPVDQLDSLPEEVKQLAVQALQAVPQLPHGAVDILYDDEQPVEEGAVVLELNPTAQIGSLVFPMKGIARDVPAAIIDYYFPETKGMNGQKSRFYFDFSDVLEPLVTKTASVTTVSAAPLGEVYGKKYTVTGDVQGIDYHRGLRKQAFERKLSGFVKNLENGNIEVIVMGTDPESVNDFKQAIFEDPGRSDVVDVFEESWEDPVKVGFEVKADLKMQVDQLKKMKLELETVQKELRRAERRYRAYSRSISWQLTLPFRKIADIVKWVGRLFEK